MAAETPPVIQPATFTFTDAEVAAVQSVQIARQAAVARATPTLRIASIAVPVLLLAALIGIDIVWYGGDMPMPLFGGLLVAFVAGMFVQGLTYKLTQQAAKRRMRQSVPQVFAPRTVRLDAGGIEQALPALRAIHAWSAIDKVEQSGGFILLWSGPALAMAIPERAFATAADAEAFALSCRVRVGAAPQPST
jgi:hypothetical protein